MRIAIVAHEYPPFRGGGIGTYTQIMSSALARSGHEVHVVTNRFRFGSNDPVHGLPLHRDGNLWVHRIAALEDDWSPAPPHDRPHDPAGQLHRHWSPYLYYAEEVARALDAICREHSIDIIEVPECAAEGYQCIRRRRLGLAFANQPIVVTLHSPIHEIHQYNLLPRNTTQFLRRHAMEDFCIRHADAINSPSALLADMVRARLERTAEQMPVDILRLPLDFADMPPRSTKPQQASGGPSLLFVGRLEPRKGVRLLVDAAVRLMDAFPGLTVQLVGRDCHAGEVPGNMRGFLGRCIPPARRSQFTFRDPLPRTDLFELYQTATACVFPAPWDNFPLTCAEAMACGACVVASHYSGMAEMIEDGKSGVLFESGNLEALVGAVRRVLETPRFSAAIREQAPARIREVCDPDVAAARRVEFYERTLSRQPAAKQVTPAAKRKCLIALRVDATAVGDAAGLESARVSATGAGADLQTFATREELDQIGPDYVLTMQQRGTLREGWVTRVLDALKRDRECAWASTWSLPARSGGVAFAAWDFESPLGLVDPQLPPHVLLHCDGYRAADAQDVALPEPWRTWDLYVSLLEQGRPGVIVPEWLSTFEPVRCPFGRNKDAAARAAEHVVGRHRRLFDRFDGVLWPDGGRHPMFAPGPPIRCTRDWLKASLPRLAWLSRRLVRHWRRGRAH